MGFHKKISVQEWKRQRFRQTSGAKMPRKSRTRFQFVRELAKVSQVEIFPNSLPFSVFVRSVLPAAASSQDKRRKTSKLFSVIQLSNILKNAKERRLFQSLSRTFASPLLKQFLSSTTR
jgi:hypothetical protein